MTVRETLEFVLGRDVPREARTRRIRETVTMLGLESLLEARPGQLSGGERQRVAVARALVTRPRLLLMDEPLANLDPPLRQSLLEELRQLQRGLGITVLYVTHSQQETFTLGDHAAVIRAGRIEQVASPRELYERPRTAFVAAFLGRCAVLSGRRLDDRVETPHGSLSCVDGHVPAGSAVSVAIRPEHVRVVDDGPFGGETARAVYHGNGFEMEITGRGWRVWATIDHELRPGSPVRFTIERAVLVEA
jgi:ABC-type Fe3+/spermidine/putrescine transport system ATPase subunit